MVHLGLGAFPYSQHGMDGIQVNHSATLHCGQREPMCLLTLSSILIMNHYV